MNRSLSSHSWVAQPLRRRVYLPESVGPVGGSFTGRKMLCPYCGQRILAAHYTDHLIARQHVRFPRPGPMVTLSYGGLPVEMDKAASIGI